MAMLATGVDTMWEEVVKLVNDQYESPQFRRLLSVRFTRDSAVQFSIQMCHYVTNRRSCWGHVQGAAPLDVKRIVWDHEHEELMGENGKPDHITLAIQEGQELFGVSAEEFENTPLLDGADVCFAAWLSLAKDSPWLEALAASSILEIRNSDEIVRGGGMSRRMGERWAEDLGIPLKEQKNHVEHVEADQEHAHMLLQVARKYATTDEARESVLRGVRRSLTIDRVFRGLLADQVEGRI